MSFHTTAENIRVDDNRFLRARLTNGDGEWVDAEIDLNNCLGNSNGQFVWGGSGFADSCESVSFNLEGGDNVPILRARLIDGDGNAVDADVNLAERIENQGGQFVVV
ncbi:Cyanovirin-N [Clohesyomyces aquaticus]|uniref:Cyanovirin-N n=1 Tax=Clohesyomyces aquaticus TaxID=1231657 RepID=A0A1Y1Z2R0_9PLEO|nr:Cyanovirin-N [Clohesyomyces aquaticus]ORY04582.1 Cyanovirin-N [Clohesyomyces aquaticus]